MKDTLKTLNEQLLAAQLNYDTCLNDGDYNGCDCYEREIERLEEEIDRLAAWATLTTILL